MMRRFVPLLIFLALASVLAIALNLSPQDLPSPLINRPAPHFSLPMLHDKTHAISPQNMKNKVWLLNVWASWCVGCRIEHPLLSTIASHAPIVGLNYKDDGAAAQTWLSQHGNPYIFSATDTDGAAALEWGVYGVPETFVIDGGGVIRHKHIGPLDEHAIHRTILPLLQHLKEEIK